MVLHKQFLKRLFMQKTTSWKEKKEKRLFYHWVARFPRYWQSSTTYQSWLTGPESCQPYLCASFTAVPSRAAWCMSFFGMQPTLTQVPPRPHLVPVRQVKNKPTNKPTAFRSHSTLCTSGVYCRRGARGWTTLKWWLHVIEDSHSLSKLRRCEYGYRVLSIKAEMGRADYIK